MTLPEDREYSSSPSVYRGSTPQGGGSLKNDFWGQPLLFYFKIQDKIVHYCNIIVYFVESIYVNESIRRNIGRIEKRRKECVSGFFLGVL